ncbi:glycosyltransferase family 2 protein [Devosia alba]|uniref:glycosyltransferase family 2 protein n=1 Tax=Devosia alba TaxID=3152360 RepID=UPI003263BA95
MMRDLGKGAAALQAPGPLVTVITVTFNAAETIQDTLDTLAQQEFREFELVVVDGASTDETVDIIRRNGEALPCINLLSEPDCGLYDAMNKGIARAHGQYVIFINSGDGLADAHVLADFAQLLSMSQQAPTIVYGHTLIEFQNGSVFLRRVRNLEYIWHGQPTLHQSVFFSLAAHQRHRYPYERYKISADYAVMAEMQLEETARTLLWDRVVSRFSNNTASVSNRNLWSRISEAWSIQRTILGVPLPHRAFSAVRRLATNLYYNYR